MAENFETLILRQCLWFSSWGHVFAWNQAKRIHVFPLTSHAITERLKFTLRSVWTQFQITSHKEPVTEGGCLCSCDYNHINACAADYECYNREERGRLPLFFVTSVPERWKALITSYMNFTHWRWQKPTAKKLSSAFIFYLKYIKQPNATVLQ